MEMLTIQVKPASLSHFQEPPFSRNVDVLFFTTFSITSRKTFKASEKQGSSTGCLFPSSTKGEKIEKYLGGWWVLLRTVCIMKQCMHITIRQQPLKFRNHFFFFAVNPMRLRHYWFIVCLINARIVFYASHPVKNSNDSSPVRCKEGSFMFNKCEERCECKKGKLTSCYRVRKDFTKMTIDDRNSVILTITSWHRSILFLRKISRN